MAQNIGDAVGNTWLNIIGIVVAAGICGMVAFAIKSSVDIATMQSQFTALQSSFADMKQDIRDIKRAVNDERQH